jgi:hypothetical protein
MISLVALNCLIVSYDLCVVAVKQSVKEALVENMNKVDEL